MYPRESQKVAEDAMFECLLAQEYLDAGKAAELAKYLRGAERRLRSGMTANEIDAVKSRAKEAFEATNE